MRNNEDRLGTNLQKHDVTPPVQQQNSFGLNFVVPTEFVNLPSKGKFYPEGHPLRDKDVIEIKQMTAKEEDLLTSKSLLKKGVALDKMIESLVVDKSINVDSLTAEDRSAIVITARITGYGPDYETTVICPACDAKIKCSFDLNNKLPPEEDEINTEVDENGYFNIELPVSKWKVTCRALNGKDEKTMFRISEMKKKSSVNDSILIDQLKLMVVAVQEINDLATIDIALENMPAGDSKYLRRVYKAIVRSFDLRQPFICDKCEYETDLEVPLNADFFWIK